MNNRIQELLDLAQAEGFTLALSPEIICEIEDAGFVVDLMTGEIVGHNSDWFSLAPDAELCCWWLLPILAVHR